MLIVDIKMKMHLIIWWDSLFSYGEGRLSLEA